MAHSLMIEADIDDEKMIKYKDKDGESKEMKAGSAKTMEKDHPAKIAYDKMADKGADDSEKDAGGKLGGGDFDRDGGDYVRDYAPDVDNRSEPEVKQATVQHKDDNDTSRIKLLEGRLAKLDKLIDEKRSNKKFKNINYKNISKLNLHTQKIDEHVGPLAKIKNVRLIMKKT